MASTFLDHFKHHKQHDTHKMPAAQTDRGREARTPTEIPAKGWKDTLMRVKKEISDDRVSMVAASIAYYLLLALVPAMTSFVLMYAWFSDPADISRHMSEIQRFLPAEAEKIIRGQLTTLASNTSSALGLSAIGTLLFSLWSASKGSTSIIQAMNIIYDEKETRGFFKRTATSIGLTFLGAIMGLVAIVVVVALPAITSALNFEDFFPSGNLIETLSNIAGWVLLLAIFTFYLSCIYRFAPNREKAKWKWVNAGSIIASVAWAATSLLFTWYASSFGNFNKTYGSLGAVVVLMTWFYLSSFIILIGGEINSELEHQTRKDSTTGAPKPMGTRGAQMADTIGPTAEEMRH